VQRCGAQLSCLQSVARNALQAGFNDIVSPSLAPLMWATSIEFNCDSGLSGQFSAASRRRAEWMHAMLGHTKIAPAAHKNPPSTQPRSGRRVPPENGAVLAFDAMLMKLA